MNDLEELTLNECLTLLGDGVVGRVAMVTPMGPRILPVNYTMYEDDIIFRTTPDGELSRFAVDSELAFEVDHLDPDHRQGWSVVAVGTAQVVDDAVELATIKREWNPEPWARGLRHLYVRVSWRDITGRRIGSDYQGPLLGSSSDRATRS